MVAAVVLIVCFDIWWQELAKAAMGCEPRLLGGAFSGTDCLLKMTFFGPKSNCFQGSRPGLGHFTFYTIAFKDPGPMIGPQSLSLSTQFGFSLVESISYI